ncbi:MAG: class I SAM-dependent methyltransferase [Zavarzinella sp.]
MNVMTQLPETERLPATRPQISPTLPGLTLVPAHCCICGTDDAEPVGLGEDFEYRTCPDTFLAVKCPHCGVVYLNPRPDEAEFARIYPNNYHAFQFQEEDFGFIYKVRCRLEAKRLLKWCRNLPDNAQILDVGCGDGFHLKLLQQYGKSGWQLSGLDLDPRAVAAAQKRGLNVQHGDLHEVNLPTQHYDRIFLIMTVEHVAHPDRLLKRAAELLKSGGRLIIVTDSTAGFDFQIFGGRHWGGYHFPRHWYLFDRGSLAKLAEKAGFQTVSVRTATSPVNWVYSIHNLLVDWQAPKWLVRRFTLHSPVSLGIFTILDTMLKWVGKGSILHGIFEKPHHSSEAVR